MQKCLFCNHFDIRLSLNLIKNSTLTEIVNPMELLCRQN